MDTPTAPTSFIQELLTETHFGLSASAVPQASFLPESSESSEDVNISSSSSRYTSSLNVCQKKFLKNPEAKYPCDVCINPLSVREFLGKPRKIRQFKCDTCSKAFTSRYDLQRHQSAHIKNRKSFDCYIASCNAQFSKYHEMRRHVINDHPMSKERPAKCKICYQNLTDFRYMILHVFKKHPDERNSNSLKKQETEETETNVADEIEETPLLVLDPTSKEHVSREIPLEKQGTSVETAQQNEEMTCHHCDIKFSDETIYFFHSIFHTQGNPFKCRKCGFQSDDKYGFNVHLILSNHTTLEQ